MIPLRYTSEFTSSLEEEYVIEIFDRLASADDDKYLILGSDGFTLNIEGGDESNPHTAIFGSVVTFNVCPEASETSAFDTFIADLSDGTQSRFSVRITKGTDVYFIGNILTDMVQIPDEAYPYFVTLKATDGLGILKEIDYTESAVAYYSGADTLLNHICNILDKTKVFDGYNSTEVMLRCYFNWLGSNQTLINSSFVESTRLFHEAFLEYESDNITIKSAMSCYDVLMNILTKFSARIFFSNGAYCIVQNHAFNEYSLTMLQYNVSRAKNAYTYPVTMRLGTAQYKRLAGGSFRFLPSTLKVERAEQGKYIKPINRFQPVYDTGSSFEVMDLDMWMPMGYFFGGDYETVNFSGSITMTCNLSSAGNINNNYIFYIKVGDYYLNYTGTGVMWEWTTTPSSFNYITPTYPGLVGVTADYIFNIPLIEAPALPEAGEAFIKVQSAWKYTPSNFPISVPEVYNWNNMVVIQSAWNFDDTNYELPKINYYAKSKKSSGATDYSDSTFVKTMDDLVLDDFGYYNSGRIQVWTGDFWINESVFVRGFSDQSGLTAYLPYLANDDLIQLVRKPVKIYEGSLQTIYYNPFAAIYIDSKQWMLMNCELNANDGIWSGQWMQLIFTTTYIENYYNLIT